MKTLLKRLALFLLISGLLLTMVGCRNSGGGGGLDDAETKAAIENRIHSFKIAVQAYNVDGMLGFLEETSSEKQLTIAEEGIKPYPKSYATLEAELREDEGKQLHWRKSPAEGGNGYTLTMSLGSITYNQLQASGATVTVPFEIIEAAQEPAINPTTTDTGRMVCTMVKIQGEWLCREMTIHFNSGGANASSVEGAALSIQCQTASKGGSRTIRTGGLGFGRLDFE